MDGCPRTKRYANRCCSNSLGMLLRSDPPREGRDLERRSVFASDFLLEMDDSRIDAWDYWRVLSRSFGISGPEKRIPFFHVAK